MSHRCFNYYDPPHGRPAYIFLEDPRSAQNNRCLGTYRESDLTTAYRSPGSSRSYIQGLGDDLRCPADDGHDRDQKNGDNVGDHVKCVPKTCFVQLDYDRRIREHLECVPDNCVVQRSFVEGQGTHSKCVSGHCLVRSSYKITIRQHLQCTPNWCYLVGEPRCRIRSEP